MSDPFTVRASTRTSDRVTTAAAGTMKPPTSLTGSQEDRTNSTAHRMELRSSKRVKPEKESVASAASESVASSFSLPIELLIDILRYLSTPQAARSAQVCRTWNAASKDARIWRSLNFTQRDSIKLHPLRLPLLEQLASLGARCGNSVETVDFGHLQPVAVERLATGLQTSAHSLKHIYWELLPTGYARPAERSKDIVDHAATLAVTTLAKQCPRLETLELFSPRLYSYVNDQLAARQTIIAKPRCFRLVVGDPQSTFSLPRGQPALFDHATTFELVYANATLRNFQVPLMDLSRFRRLLERNSAIERLTVHSLAEIDIFPEHFSVSAPSLKYLDLRFAQSSITSMTLEAPELCELAVHGHFLRCLAPASKARLSALTLHLEHLASHALQDVVVDVEMYRSCLKLVVDVRSAADLLELLLRRFVWPGLEEVNIEVTDSTISELIGVMSARQVGAVGGTTEKQYYEVVSKAKEKLPDVRTCQVADYLAEAEEVFAMVGAVQHDASAQTLCAQVHWKIINVYRFGGSNQILDWLSKQPNVSVERPRGS